MKKIRLIIFLSSMCLVVFNGAQAQSHNKHSKTTMYPQYETLIMAGYQGWFHAPKNGVMYPDAKRIAIDMWPDVNEYKKTYPTGLKHADGSVARFFDSSDQSTIDLHFRWMQTYGVDGVFMQRFFGAARPRERHGDQTQKVLRYAFDAASKYERAIAVMYDLSGLRAHGEDCSALIEDWKYLVDSLKVTNQSGRQTYVFYRNKPLVVIWGVGFPDRAYNIRDIGLKRLIDFLHNDPEYGGCSVMLGVPTFWRDLNADCVNDPYLHELIKEADLILPWMVQRFTPLLHFEMDRYRDVILADMTWCKTNGVGYVPCVTPGFSWHNLSRQGNANNIGGEKPVASIPRMGGKFYWDQIATAIKCGAEMLYVAMFDEVNEGTAIFKIAKKPPVSKDAQFVQLDTDEPSDHYLWLTGQASRILKHEMPLTFSMPERQK